MPHHALDARRCRTRNHCPSSPQEDLGRALYTGKFYQIMTQATRVDVVSHRFDGGSQSGVAKLLSVAKLSPGFGIALV